MLTMNNNVMFYLNIKYRKLLTKDAQKLPGTEKNIMYMYTHLGGTRVGVKTLYIRELYFMRGFI